MALNIQQLSLHYGKKRILENLTFDVQEGEVIALFGPSGVGKTSLLKMIAGIQPIKEGTIEFTEDFSPKDTVIVFQDYWLFPHLSVFDNIAFGLKARKYSKAEIDEQVAQMLAQFDLQSVKEQFPQQLSGGQKQRVALARAIVLRPKLLLMDEPFANLDGHLRIRMREYLRELQKEYRFSVILVTHDKEEAFQLADRMVILLDGEVQQIASPQEVYYRPSNRKVADFIGEMNYLPGEIKGDRFFFKDDTELQIENPRNISGKGQLLLPYGLAFKVVQQGLPARVEKIEWSPNGNRATLRIGEMNCFFTNLQQELEEDSLIHLQFHEPLQVMR